MFVDFGLLGFVSKGLSIVRCDKHQEKEHYLFPPKDIKLRNELDKVIVQ
jgi:hypothetical protein